MEEFGRCVHRGAAVGLELLLLKLAAEPKVDELHVEGGVDHDVVELEVPVHNTLRWCACGYDKN